MSRPVIAACGVLLLSFSVNAAEPKPLWEIEATGDKSTAPGWIGFSPDGRAVAAVIVHEAASDSPDFTYKLRVWDAASRKERFSADLGHGKTPTWNDELATFPGDDTILTGGLALTARSLADGKETTTHPTGGTADHTVWAVADLRDTFHLRREPSRTDKPIELLYHSPVLQVNDFRSNRIRPTPDTHQVEILPPHAGLRAQAIAMSADRNRLVTAFRDEAAAGSKPQHTLMLYRIKTVPDFELDDVAEATNPHPGSISAVAFAPDSKTLATGGEDGSVCLWDVKNAGSLWKPRATITGADGRVVAMAFSPDWRFVAAVTWDKAKPNLLLIDADSGILLRAVRLDRCLTALTWSQDGRTLVTGGYSGKLTAWDVPKLLKGE